MLSLILKRNVALIRAVCKKTQPRSVFFAAMLAVLFLVAVLPSTAQAASIMSAEDRATTIAALKKIQSGKWTEAEKDIAATRDPLAAKLYYWFQYTKKDDAASFARVSSFIRQNKDWPWQNDLRMTAEKRLLEEAKKPDTKPSDADILEWFNEFTPKTTDGMALYLKTLSALDRDAEMREKLNSWWERALITPSEQSSFLNKYKPLLEEKSQIRRMSYLLSKGHYTNGRAIAALLGKGYPQLAEARIAVAEGQSGVDAAIARVPPHLEHDAGLLYERLKWRRVNKHNIGAMDILFNPPAAANIPNLDEWWKERHIIARRLIEEKQYENAYLLVAAHQQEEGLGFAQAEFLAGFLALEFVNKPWRAFEHFEALYYRVETPISKSRGAYWTAKASEALGNKEVADAWYKTAAQYVTTYYGQLALEKLKQQGRLIDYKLPGGNLSAEAAFHAQDMVQVVKLLHAAGMRKETTAFIYALSDELERPEEYVFLADLAADIGHYHNGLYIAKKGLGKGFLLVDRAYPTLLSEMKNIQVEWALVHGLMRQESSFDIEAQSHVGARGLMQLMPATAKETAYKIGVQHRLEWLTQRPSHNILLGSAYLQMMLDRYDGSYPMALAAYNGGPGRVDRWVREIGDPRKGEISYESWVELLPVYETRNYVQRVMEAVYVYRIKLGTIQRQQAAPLYLAYTQKAVSAKE